jgi:hypothetical protein
VLVLLEALAQTVTHLGLRNLSFTDELVPALARSPALQRLEVLDLSLGVLLDGAAPLRRHADAFRHLHRLDVTHTGLRDFEALQAVIPALAAFS